ncbi:MAG TPA: hypothetical protein VF912_21805 [Anaeromyxobacter sp.]
MGVSRRVILAAAACLAAAAVRADTVEVSSTTLLNTSQQTRGGVAGQKPELVTVAPAFEILTISARDVRNPVLDDLQVVVSTWGAWELADRRWDAGTGATLTGDVVTGYLQGRLLDRHLTLRLGREQVATGVGRMIQIDGGEAVLLLPLGFRASGYAGAPVSQRFASRSGLQSWNPVPGDLAFGGRLGWSLALPGVPGRGLDLGASANVVEDNGDPVRREVGGDFRLRPGAGVTVVGLGAYSVYDGRFSEASLRTGWEVTRKLHVDADWRFLAPELLLARNSILSVFSAEERNEVGLAATYAYGRNVTFGGAYHLQIEPGAKESASSFLGHEAEASAEWEHGHTLAGIEVLFLDAFENGYVASRVFGRCELGRFFAAADVLGHLFREEVNGGSTAVTGTLTAGVQLAKGFSAVLSGRAGMTPLLERTFDVMAKLVYGQTYRSTEIR